MFLTIVLVLVATTLAKVTSAEVQFGLQGRTLNAVLAKEGDINFGQVTEITTYNSSSQTCGPAIIPVSCEAIEMAIYAIDKINRRTDVLPNITIGMVLFDTCSKDTKALEVVTYLDPDHPQCSENSGPTTTDYQNRTVDGYTEELRNYRVVAIVGPRASVIALAITGLMGYYQIPLIGTTTASDILSDKSRYEYFLRVTAPDRFIAATIAKVLKYFGWSYVSVVYNYGAYGENAYQQLSNLLTGDICIAIARSIPAVATDVTYADIVDALIANDKAKVIVVLVDDVARALNLFSKMRSRREVGTFVWIGGHYVTNYEYELKMENMLEGSVFVTHPSVPIQDFVDYLPRVTPQMREGNRWILNVWEQKYNCSFRYKPGVSRYKSACSMNLTLTPDICPTDAIQHDRLHDAYMVYAQALHIYIADNCPDGFIQKQILLDCIKGDKLLSLLHESTFEGVLGTIKFDENGDMLENVLVKQFYTPYSNSTRTISKEVGIWNATEDRLYINSTLLDWSVFRNSSDVDDLKPPSSICSGPCLNTEFLIREPLRPCCWTCVECRNNEITLPDRTGCEACPIFYWPDEANGSQCVQIPPDFLRPTDFHSVMLGCLTTLSSLLVVACGAEYIRRRKHVLMEGFTFHLRFISLAGMLLGSVTTVLLLFHPSAFWHLCSVRGACFHLSVCITYTPQLVKIVQIYRVFVSRRISQLEQRAPLKSDCTVVAILISLQVILLVATEASAPSGPTLKMPNIYTEYVEIYCYRPNFSFLLPLSYNAAILFGIAGTAFMSRKLPMKFDEAWLMFASVSATSFCWMILIPTYFTVSPIHLQAAILGYALILNCLVIVIVQNLPLVYSLMAHKT